MNVYKSQTDVSVNSRRLETNQNKEEVKNKVGELTLEIRSVASSLDECKSPLSTRILYGCLQRVTIPEAVVIQLVLLMMSSVLLETC